MLHVHMPYLLCLVYHCPEVCGKRQQRLLLFHAIRFVEHEHCWCAHFCGSASKTLQHAFMIAVHLSSGVHHHQTHINKRHGCDSGIDQLLVIATIVVQYKS